MEIEFVEQVKQELNQIANQLKRIPNIHLSYMEYLSALLYIVYEYKSEFQEMKQYKIGEKLLEKLQSKLEEIRKKEKSAKLFHNIDFDKRLTAEEKSTVREVVQGLIELIIKIEKIEKKSKVVLAEAFEYVIMKAEQERGVPSADEEIYTPKGVVKTLVKLLAIQEKQAIFNPTCGTGNFIVEAVKSIENTKKSEVYIFGETTSIRNYNICMTNLWLHDIYHKRIKQEEEEAFPLFDIILGNPPFSEEKSNRIRSLKLQQIYYRYGISETTKSYIKYLAEMLERLNEVGKMAIIVPQGFLFKKEKSEYRMRRDWIDKSYIDAVISLPEKLFYDTKIPVVVLVIKKKRERKKEVLFIDASREYTSKRKTNILTVENQDKIAQTYQKYQEEPYYSCIVTLEEIRNQDYNLNIRQYVKIQTEEEEVDQRELERKVLELTRDRRRIQGEIAELIEKIR